MRKTIVVTGGSGFIGANFVHHMLSRHQDVRIVNLDLLTYAGNPDNLKDIAGDLRYAFVHGDIVDRDVVMRTLATADSVVHFAAESHVDRRITGPEVFIRTNVLGTQVRLEHALAAGVKRFIHVSTDEVYGSLGPQGHFTEMTPLAPNSPYSASKAGSDLLVRAYHETYGFPAVITRCSNNYGPYQYPEKLIPLMISLAMENKSLPVYGDGLNVRDWLFVGDHCAAIDRVLEDGKPGEVYNIGGNNEWQNIAIVKLILKLLGKPESLITFVADRLGHDRRYAIDAGKMRRELGWEPLVSFEDGIRATINWYQNNPDWIARIKSGACRSSDLPRG